MSSIKPKRIYRLSVEVAKQIAAGEVVERPSSVLKELMENSIDAGSSQIDVVVQHGGVELIQIQDNGTGILKQDLALAVTQHATSKISKSQDLSQINSLGFRGEALASIDSVAKMSIISRASGQDQAWQIKHQHVSNSHANSIMPAAHPVGTTVKVENLFYNVPARKKFLRSERTEFNHLEENFRRIALSHFNIAFTLTNHDKIIKQLPSCKNELARYHRLGKLCGNSVVKNSLLIDCTRNGMRLWGWLGCPANAKSQGHKTILFY